MTRWPTPRSDLDWPSLIPEVARLLLGDPNPRLSSGNELRYGNRGSLIVNTSGPRAGTWHDFESGEGGGVLDLIERELNCDRSHALQWLADEGLVDRGQHRLARRARPGATAGRHRQSPRYRTTQKRPEAPSRPAHGPGGTQGPDSKTVHLVEPLLAATVPADDTPAREYLTRRRTWPPLGTGPDLPDSVRWLPREAVPTDVNLPPAAAGTLLMLAALRVEG